MLILCMLCVLESGQDGHITELQGLEKTSRDHNESNSSSFMVDLLLCFNELSILKNFITGSAYFCFCSSLILSVNLFT